MHIKTLFSAFGLSSVSCCFASQTCLGLGIAQASLASALGFDRLSLGHIARYAPSFRTAIYSMKSPKSQESNF